MTMLQSDARILAMICCLLCPIAFATFAVVGQYQAQATPMPPADAVVAMALTSDAAK